MDVRDVRMIERGEHLRLATEPREALRILSDLHREHLERDVAVQFGVTGAVDLAHATSADGASDFVGADAVAGGQPHGVILAAVRRQTYFRRET